LNSIGNKNPETFNPQPEDPAVKEQIDNTKTLLAAMGINIEQQMKPGNREKVKQIIKVAAKGELSTKSELEAKGYKRIDFISTREGFTLDKVLAPNGKIEWDATSIPTYIHNCLKDKVILGKFEDDGSGKLAIYTK